MKRLAILALFGALTTISFLPGQTAPLGAPEKRIAKADGGQDGKDHRQSQRDHQNTPEAVSYIQVSANKSNGLSDKTSNDLGIQRKVEWFTGVLAFVGVLQVAALIWQAILFLRTLRAIRRQAGQMETQTDILKASVAVAQKSADAAETSAQIAWAYLSHDSCSTNLGSPQVLPPTLRPSCNTLRSES